LAHADQHLAHTRTLRLAARRRLQGSPFGRLRTARETRTLARRSIMTRQTLRLPLLACASALLSTLFGCAAHVAGSEEQAQSETQPAVVSQTEALQRQGADTPEDVRLDCDLDCLERCNGDRKCAGKCTAQCALKLPPYYCSLQDNSVNHTICQAGMFAWLQACKADCKLLGDFTSLCQQGCQYVYSVDTCPDATICV
jgi:hypothetical protein